VEDDPSRTLQPGFPSSSPDHPLIIRRSFAIRVGLIFRGWPSHVTGLPRRCAWSIRGTERSVPDGPSGSTRTTQNLISKKNLRRCSKILPAGDAATHQRVECFRIHKGMSDPAIGLRHRPGHGGLILFAPHSYHFPPRLSSPKPGHVRDGSVREDHGSGDGDHPDRTGSSGGLHVHPGRHLHRNRQIAAVTFGRAEAAAAPTGFPKADPWRQSATLCRV